MALVSGWALGLRVPERLTQLRHPMPMLPTLAHDPPQTEQTEQTEQTQESQ